MRLFLQQTYDRHKMEKWSGTLGIGKRRKIEASCCTKALSFFPIIRFETRRPITLFLQHRLGVVERDIRSRQSKGKQRHHAVSQALFFSSKYTLETVEATSCISDEHTECSVVRRKLTSFQKILLGQLNYLCHRIASYIKLLKFVNYLGTVVQSGEKKTRKMLRDNEN